MSSLNDLNAQQHERLLAFKAEHGRTWKFKLLVMWANAQDAQQEDGHLLRQIRNDLGPSWLIKLPL